jgi:poly(hydroxyalkanoate) granule-associated protein
MLKKAKAAMQDETPGDAASDALQGMLDSPRQVWLAGLGALARAQQEGMKMFETLVRQGERLETKTRTAAVQTATAAKDAASAKAKEMQAMAGGTWDKLEGVFEDRVARALSKLGVYTQNDVERLAERVDALSEAVNELVKAAGVKPARKKATRRAAAHAEPSGGAAAASPAPAARPAKKPAKAAAKGGRKAKSSAR